VLRKNELGTEHVSFGPVIPIGLGQREIAAGRLGSQAPSCGNGGLSPGEPCDSTGLLSVTLRCDLFNFTHFFPSRCQCPDLSLQSEAGGIKPMYGLSHTVCLYSLLTLAYMWLTPPTIA